MHCDDCGGEKQTKTTPVGNERLPRGWKRWRERVYCSDCWRRAYLLRPLSMSVLAPLGATKDEWWDALRSAWRHSAELATWASQQLFAHDVTLPPGADKFPKREAIYLYGLAREQGWIRDGDAAACQCILQWVEHSYVKRRKEIVYRRTSRPPAFTYPCPWRIHEANWSAEIDQDGGHPLIHIPLGGRQWTLRLWSSGRGRYSRARHGQMSQLRLLAERAVKQGELMLVADYAHGREGGTATARANGGGQRKLIGCRVKMAAWWPRADRSGLSGDPVHCHTDTESLLVYRHADEIHRLNYHHVRRWVHEYERRRAAFSGDMQPERRAPGRKRRLYVASQQAQRRKHHARIKTACQQAAAAVANYAARKRAGEIIYDDTCRSWHGVESFPWHLLRESLVNAADRRGVAVVEASGTVLTDPLGVLAAQQQEGGDDVTT